jgi:hypothetical protein
MGSNQSLLFTGKDFLTLVIALACVGCAPASVSTVQPVVTTESFASSALSTARFPSPLVLSVLTFED